jgi:hypothetical protein
MQIIKFKYAAICKTCRQVNYPVETFLRRDDGEIFDPYEIVDEFSSSCIICENESRMDLKVIQYEKRILDMTRAPIPGEMSLSAVKENGKISHLNFASSFDNFTPYDQYNALTVMELYNDFRIRQLNGTAKISPNEQHPLEIYRENEFGSFNYQILFKTTVPFVKVKGEYANGFSIDEIKKVINDLKKQIQNIMKENMLVTFTHEFDSRDGFLL